MTGTNGGRPKGSPNTKSKHPVKVLEADPRSYCTQLNTYQIESGGLEPYNAIYRCAHCGKWYVTQEANFYTTTSPLYKKNNGYGVICKSCCQEIFEENYTELQNMNAAMEITCHLLDLPWDAAIMDRIKELVRGHLVGNYINALGMAKYSSGFSYVDTMKRTFNRVEQANESMGITATSMSEVKNVEAIKAAIDAAAVEDGERLEKSMKFFGTGYTPAQLYFLQEQYDDWTSRHECQTKAQEELYKNICVVQLEIQEARQSGRSTKEAIKTLQDLMTSANIKPKQQDNSLAEQNTFGTLIQKWEEEKPIPEPSEEWKDVDGIKKYISTWFLGHLCHMFGFENDWSRMYEEEISEYTVEPPKYDDEEFGNTDASGVMFKSAAADIEVAGDS